MWLDFVLDCCFGLVLELVVDLANWDETAVFLLYVSAHPLALVSSTAVACPCEGLYLDQSSVTLHDIVQYFLPVQTPLLS